ncbi:MAG: 2-isopropylmalate synthase, partial [Bacillota bacterium]
MIEFNKRSNQLIQSKYRYELQDVTEPNLYREIFDYDHIPKITFNNRLVPINIPDEIWMTDTTFRDGQQSVSPFSVKQIVHLFKLLSRLGGPNGLVRQSEFFIYTKKDREALEECQALGLAFPEITSWIRANPADFDLVKAVGVEETGILVSCSDYHI